MPNDKTRILYEAVSKDYDIGTYDEFAEKMSIPEKRRAFYDGVGQEFALGSFEEFESKVKKKDNTVSTSANGSSGFQNPLLEVGKNVFNQPPAKTSPKPEPPANIPVKEDDFSYGDVQPEPLKVKPFIKEKPIIKPTPAVTKIQDLQNRTKKISPELVGKEEEFVVPELNYQFKEHGFKFEQTGVGDAMKVIAPNGKETTINLDPLLSKWEVLESDKLKKFISDNSIRYDKVDKVASQQSAYNKRIIDEKEIEATNQRFNDEIKSFEYEVQQLNLLEPGTPEYTKKQNELVAAQNKLQSNQKELERSIGKYVEMKASQGTFGGYLRNQLIEGIAEGASGIAGLAIDAYSLANNIPDATQKAMKKEALPALRGSLDYLKDDTTKEYDAGFVGGAVGGLVKSLPAILASEGMPLVMAGQISDGLDQEMESNPDFEDISELEKLGVKTPMIIGGAILEKYGLRNALESKGLLNDVVLKAIGQSTKNTTVKSFGELIEQDVKNRIAKGALKIGAGGLAEFETGASQELLDITTKEIYNAAKEKEMFQTPDSFGEGLKQVAKAGLQEAIGGLILSTPSAISTAYKKGNFTKVDDVQIGVFQAVANDPTVLNAIDTDLKMKVNSGDLTPEEAEGQLNDFRQAVGVLNSIETEGLEPEQVKEKMGLAKKVKELEIKKEGKIPSDKKIIQTKIDALNEKLITIGTTKKEQDALTKDEEGLKKSREKEKINKDEKAKTTPQAKQTETIRETDVLEESPAVEQSAAVDLPSGNRLVKNAEKSVIADEGNVYTTDWYDVRDKDEKVVGNISLADKGDFYQVSNVQMNNTRTGLGTEVYTTLSERLAKPIYSDPSLTDEAKGLWDKLVKNGVAEKFTETINVDTPKTKKSFNRERYRTIPNVSKSPEKIDTKTERVEDVNIPNTKETPESKTENISIAKKMLSNLGIKADFSGYSDTNGISVYFRDANGKKIRVSNHSVASKDRMNNEVLLYFDDKTLGLGGKTGVKSYSESNKREAKRYLSESAPTAKELAETEYQAAKAAFQKAMGSLQSGGFYALPEFVNLVKAAIKRGVVNAKEFIKEFKKDFPNVEIDEVEAEKVFNREAGIEEKSEKSGGEVKKTVATVRAYEGDIRKGVKKQLEKLGLTREIESQSVAKAKAKEFVESVGEEAALEAVRNNDVQDAAGAYVWNELIESVGKKLMLETDPKEVKRLERFQAQLFDELSREALSRGRFNAALDDIYQSSEIVSYNVEKRIKEYKDANQGEISPEIEAKFRDLDKQLQEVRKKLAEAEERAKKAEGEVTIENIRESADRDKKQKTSTKIRKDTDWIVTKIKEAKIHRPGMFAAATPASLVWDGAVESVAAAIKITGRSAEAIAKGIEYVKNSDWYKSLSDTDKKNAVKQFADFWKELQPRIEDGKIKIPGSLIHDLVEGGADTIEKLVSEIKEIMIEDYPDVSDREIRDAITEYGKTRNLNKEEIATQIRKIKRIGRIVSALEDVNAKKRPLRSGVQRDKLDAQERALNKELREAMKELPVDEALEAEQQKTATDAAKQRLQNQIEDLQREIDKGELVPRKVRTVKDDAELISLKAQRDKLKAEHEAIFKDEEYQQAKRLEITKKNTQRRIEDLQRRLKEGDFSKKTKSPLLKDSELIKLRAEKLRIQEEYDKELFKVKLKNRTKVEKIKDALWEIWGIPRILMATGEASFVGIQGLKQSIAHPTHAAKAFKNSWSAFKSEKNADRFLNEIKAQDWYPVLKDSKLALTEPKAEISAREELFYSGWTNMIWDNLGKMVVSPIRFKSKEAFDKAAETWSKLNPFKAVERAAIGYLDTLRVMRFLDGMVMLEMQGKTFDSNPKDFKDVADAINTMTGRASLGKYGEPSAELLSRIFFSPRNWASGIKTATPYALYHFGRMTPTARKMAIADFSKFLGFTTAMVALAAVYLNSDDDDETKVEFDPRSTDFMKIKLGNTRVDPWGGTQQQVVLSTRLMAWALTLPFVAPNLLKGAYKKGDEVMPLGVYHKTPTAFKLLGQQATNKLNPAASIAFNFLAANRSADGTLKDDYGNEITPQSQLQDKFNPIFWGTVGELLKEDPTALDGLLTFYAFWGGGVNVYDKKPSNSEKNRMEKREKRD